MQSDYFGIIEEDWAGFSSEYKFTIPHFEKEVEVFLGSEYSDDGEETEIPPTEDEIAEYEYTLKNFLENIDVIINDIKQKTFEYYNEIYAKYYEKEFVVEGFFETDVEKGTVHEPLNYRYKRKTF